MKNCTYPWTGMVIDSVGNIRLCCVITNNFNSFNKNQIENYHISKVDSLIDFFNGEEYEAVRKRFGNGFYNLPECSNCKRWYDEDRPRNYRCSQTLDPSLNKLQYLAFSTSNVCNQSCVMCDSHYSNQWLKIKHLFDYKSVDIIQDYSDTDSDDISQSILLTKYKEISKTHILSDKDINKINECLPDLKELEIKGGEPFADIRNYKIIKKLFEVNDECVINIITNGSLIPEKYMDLIFRNPKRFNISASVDAIGKRYEWIRGTPWEKTNNTLKELYYQTGLKPSICPTLSAYNINSTTSIVNWANESEYIKTTDNLMDYYNNSVEFPSWACHRKVFTQEQIDTITDLPWPVISEYENKYYNKYVKNTQIMNKIRGFEIDIWNDMG